MPRDGSGVFSKPAGTTFAPNTTIESAKMNALADDIASDLNTARPITAGGTGATSAVGGFDALSVKGADLASASTVNLAAATGGYVHITGTTTITSFGTAAAGVERVIRFAGALTLTHNATSLILPGAANITTAADDVATFRSEGSGNWRCTSYQRASLASVDPFVDVASAATTDLGAASSQNVRVTGTTTITSLGTVAAGTFRRVRFAAALTLTHNATSLILPGAANILTAANDSFEAVSLGSGNWIVTSYQRAALPSTVIVNTANGYGSTNTKIRRFTNVEKNQGADITYADSATLGASFTVNASGIYAVTYSDNFTAQEVVGLSVNTTAPTTSIRSIPIAEVLTTSMTAVASGEASSSWTGYLASGAVVRPHSHASAASGASTAAKFTITRVG